MNQYRISDLRPSELTTGKVVVRVLERDLVLVRTSANRDWLIPDGPVWVGVVVAVVNVAEVINVLVKVPVTGNVVKGVVLHHEVDDMLDVATKLVPFGTLTSSAGVGLSWVELLGWQRRGNGDQTGGDDSGLHVGCKERIV